MMDFIYSLMVLIHILLLVFWVGTDVGVFLAAKVSERTDLSIETRSTVLSVGMVLDRLPRSALVLIIPSGLFLASYSGLMNIPPIIFYGICILAGIWLAILWLGFMTKNSATEAKCMSINLLLNGVSALLVTAVAIWMLTSGAYKVWIGLKFLCVGLIFAVGVVLDIQFRPAVVAFSEIMTKGATEDRDMTYSQAIAPVYLSVLTIYLLAIIAAGLGIAKP
jgi:hypothetical protein